VGLLGGGETDRVAREDAEVGETVFPDCDNLGYVGPVECTQIRNDGLGHGFRRIQCEKMRNEGVFAAVDCIRFR